MAESRQGGSGVGRRSGHPLGEVGRQVTPFIDFDHAELRFNGEWLNKVSLPQLVGPAGPLVAVPPGLSGYPPLNGLPFTDLAVEQVYASGDTPCSR